VRVSALISRTNSSRLRARRLSLDSAFEFGVRVLALVPLALIIGIVALLLIDASLAIARYGFNFLLDSTWDPVFEKFGAAPYIYGTVFTSIIALIVAVPVALGAALFLSEYAPAWLREPLAFVIELLAAIPSIIYGLWGLFVLAPLMRGSLEPLLKTLLAPIPLVNTLVEGPTFGRDFLIAGIILAIMILPTILSIGRAVLQAVPQVQREGMLGLGATHWETIQHVVLPYARPGIVAASLLGLARALGETMAVTMVIGNSSSKITPSLFTPGYTIASAIANQFTEADKAVYFSAVVELALVLLLVAMTMNIFARVLIARASHGPKGARL
jgi:phosphate transport system permease protein